MDLSRRHFLRTAGAGLGGLIAMGALKEQPVLASFNPGVNGTNAVALAISASTSSRLATYVIAASDAPSHVKSAADAVCTGINDHLVIQQAIDSLPAGQALVHLSGGHFYPGDMITLDTARTKAITLEGEGRGDMDETHENAQTSIVITKAFNATSPDPGEIPGGTALYCKMDTDFTSVLLRDFKITMKVGSPAQRKVTGIYVWGAWKRQNVDAQNVLINYPARGYYSYGSHDELFNIWIRNHGDHGIMLRDSPDGNLTNCLTEGVNDAWGRGIALYGSRQHTLTNCWAGTAGAEGFYFENSDRNMMIGCKADHCAWNGAKFLNSDACQVIGGQFWDNCQIGGDLQDRSGIALTETSQHCALIGAQVFDDQSAKTQQYGIQMLDSTDSVTLLGNQVWGHASLDIQAGAGGSIATDIEVKSAELTLSSSVAVDLDAYFATKDCVLVGYRAFYTQATNANTGVQVRIGKYAASSALNNAYFSSFTSETSKARGYSKYYNVNALSNRKISRGDVITVGTAGKKLGSGRIVISLLIANTM